MSAGEVGRRAIPACVNRPIIAILILAAVLRLATTPFTIIHHPDEVWQYLEPAYGIVTGWRIVPWEYRLGLRTWLLPTLYAGPIALGKAVADGTTLYLILARALSASLSVGIVASGIVLAARLSRVHALVVGLVLAIWFEQIYFSARLLSEPIGTLCLMAAAACLLPRASAFLGRRIVAGGILLGLAFAARFQLAPALAVLALASARWDFRRGWVPLLVGAAIGLMIDALADAAQGAIPFRWIVVNFHANLVEGRSANYGTEAPLWYLAEILRVWGWAALPLTVLTLIGARKMPILALVALVNVAAHMVIPHKEYRFIHGSSTIFIVLAAVGSVDVARSILRQSGQWRPVAAMLVVFWLLASVASALSSGGEEQWKSSTALRRRMALPHAAPEACGLALFQTGGPLAMAYGLLDRPIRIYVFDGPDALADLTRAAPAFNALMTTRDRGVLLSPIWKVRACLPAKAGVIPLCLYARKASCTPPPVDFHDMNSVVARAGV